MTEGLYASVTVAAVASLMPEVHACEHWNVLCVFGGTGCVVQQLMHVISISAIEHLTQAREDRRFVVFLQSCPLGACAPGRHSCALLAE